MVEVVTEGRLVSAEVFFGMPRNGRRQELVRGRVVEMTPTGWRHGSVEGAVYRILDEFVERHGLGEVAVGEVGHVLAREPDSVRGADVSFLSNERLQQVDDPNRFVQVAPDLAVDVLSPSDTASDVLDKVRQYREAGTRAVWLADPILETMTVCRPSSRTISWISPSHEALPHAAASS